MMKMSDNKRGKNVVMKVLLFYLLTFLPKGIFIHNGRKVIVR